VTWFFTRESAKLKIHAEENLMIATLFTGARLNQNLFEASGDLILRVFVGITLAFGHGLGKLPPSVQFIEGVSNLGFPQPTLFAWAAAAAELVGGILLALGLFTRPAAGAVAFTMLVAGFGRHAADPFHIKELALLYLSVALFYFLSGAGRYYVDAMISKRR
jgi:putative oxidoreductase